MARRARLTLRAVRQVAERRRRGDGHAPRRPSLREPIAVPVRGLDPDWRETVSGELDRHHTAFARRARLRGDVARALDNPVGEGASTTFGTRDGRDRQAVGWRPPKRVDELFRVR